MKHTKGEWYPVEFGGYWMILNSNHYDGDDILESNNVGEDIAEANAKLMAAAPELLDACITVLKRKTNQYGETPELCGELREILESAIKKAGHDNP